MESNHFASLELYQYIQVYEQANANIMWWEFQVPKLAGNHLQSIDFTFVTKDQGWASVQGSCSWIQAQFLGDDEQNLLKQLNPDQTRILLVSNYCEQDFVEKKHLYNDARVVQKLNKVKIYLRSAYPGWEISCKGGKAKLTYKPMY